MLLLMMIIIVSCMCLYDIFLTSIGSYLQANPQRNILNFFEHVRVLTALNPVRYCMTAMCGQMHSF